MLSTKTYKHGTADCRNFSAIDIDTKYKDTVSCGY
jgi:hypothetical protein